jgi:hypothetical protein
MRRGNGQRRVAMDYSPRQPSKSKAPDALIWPGQPRVGSLAVRYPTQSTSTASPGLQGCFKHVPRMFLACS